MRSVHRITTAAAALLGLAAPALAQEAGRDVPVARRAAPDAVLLQVRGAAVELQAAERARRLREAADELRRREIQSWPEVIEGFARTVRIGRNGTLDLQNVAGDIAITGGGGDQVRIEATKRVRHRVASTARTTLQNVQITVSERGGNVEIRTDHRRDPRNGVAAVDYRISVPNGANLVIDTVSGNVRVSNVGGELRANAMSGNIVTTSVRRVRLLTTVSGDVEVADGEADELTAQTVEGDVILRNLKGRLLDLTTVNGDARLVNVELDRAAVRSMSGDLEFNGRLARSGRYEFRTHYGNIRITPAGSPGFDLDATSYSGDVRSDFTLKIVAGAAGRDVRTLRGTFGDAAAILSAQSFAGDILIVRR
jgi:DUF4097 and DUF4098 domain-containing protein YvlB